MLVQALVASPVIAINSSASIAEAAKMMLDNHISGLPVVDANGTLAGIVSESDFLRRGELQTERQRSWLSGFLASPGKVADEYVRAHGRKVGEVMSSGVITTRRRRRFPMPWTSWSGNISNACRSKPTASSSGLSPAPTFCARF
jgi:CBS domain-containing protein